MDRGSQAIAVAGFNWVALLPTAAIDLSSRHDSPVLAVLPSFYSPGLRPSKQPPPASSSSPTDSATTDTVGAAPESPSKAYDSDEAWLRAQTDAHRLEATWMTADMSSIPEVMQYQQDQADTQLPAASMPPSGLIRSICFVGEQFNITAAQLHLQHSVDKRLVAFIVPVTSLSLLHLQGACSATQPHSMLLTQNSST